MMTSREDDQNRKQLSITGNQINFVCNSPKELQTVFNFLNANFTYWYSQNTSEIESELGTAQPQLVLSYI